MNKMVRKTLAAVLALTVLSGGLPATVGSMDLLKPAIKVSAAEIDHGSCGENVSWVLDESGTLTISGTGAMQDFFTSLRHGWSLADRSPALSSKTV